MGRTYTLPAADGTQWILWIRQSTAEKAIYFNNAFPHEITGFADRLDAMLQNAGLANASWTLITRQQGIAQQAALWDGLRPEK